MSSQDPYSGMVPSPFPGGMPPIYPVGANLGSWGHPPSSPGANGMGLGMPMYWQGYYRPPAGLPHLPQQSVPYHQHPGVPYPLTQQEQVQQTTINFSSSMPLQQPANILSDSSALSVFSTSKLVDITTSSTTTVDSRSKLSSLPLSAASSTSITTASSKQEVSVVLTPASRKPRIIFGSIPSSQIPNPCHRLLLCMVFKLLSVFQLQKLPLWLPRANCCSQCPLHHHHHHHHHHHP